MNSKKNRTGPISPDFNLRTTIAYRRWRNIKNIITRYLVACGGISVIIAIVLIAFYLLYVVIPIFKPASIEPVTDYTVPGSTNKTLLYAMEEQREIGMRLDELGQIVFFETATGKIKKTVDLKLPEGMAITAVATGDQAERVVGLGLSDGSVLLFRHDYAVSYTRDNVRVITPEVVFPFDEAPIRIIPSGAAIRNLSVQYDDEQMTIAAHDNSIHLRITTLVKEDSMLDETVETTRKDSTVTLDTAEIVAIRVNVEQRQLYVADRFGYIYFYNIVHRSNPRLVQKVRAMENNMETTTIEFLSGGISILVGDSSGRIAQWFPVRDENSNYTLRQIRVFEKQHAPITAIAPEYSRKGFVAADSEGRIGIYHTTAHHAVFLDRIDEQALRAIVLSPRANALLVENDKRRLRFWHVHNEHPEVSFSSLWGKVWYESRDQPQHIWQSSSASSDFEPKFSLTPLAFGTFKAAFYAMMFAIPLGILGAIYTAYFMAPGVRQLVKPTIEIMEALPTVILGFLAGLWLAPFVEVHLPGMFLMFFIIPLNIIIAAALWKFIPDNCKRGIADGFEAVLLIPIIILSIAISIQISQPVEQLFFDGNIQLWLNQAGITYSQRNSMVVGIAMGFAIIPTIFSISEDAIYGVPKHLITGSLALGATPWQTMVRIMLLTASPGIFSAVMIGLGRAVGETMIVVMATGNTPIINMNIFEGFRAMSANIAVEMPETEVNSTHYRILFLGALVLFAITFCFNTMAEIVRQRLRKKYSSL